MVTGQKRWFIISCYVLPGSADEAEHIVTVFGHCAYGVYPITVININVDLFQTKGRYHEKDIVEMVAVEVLNDMATHFRPRRGRRDRRKWSMVRGE